MPRAGSGRDIIEGITVCVENVRISILIQIHHRNAAAPKILVCGAVNHVWREFPFAVVFKHVNLFPFLRNQSDNIQVAIPIHVMDRGVNGPGKV